MNPKMLAGLAAWVLAATAVISSAPALAGKHTAPAGKTAVPDPAAAIRPKTQKEQEDALLAIWKDGRVSEALREAQRAVAAYPQSANLHYMYGRLLTATVQKRKAIEELKKAAALWPDSPDVHSELGLALDLAGDEAGAIREIDRALELDPQHEDALGERADLDGRRAIRAGERESFPEGSVGQLVQDCMGMFTGNQIDKALDQCVDESVLNQFQEKAGLSKDDRASMALGLAIGFKNALSGEGGVGKAEFVGYRVLKDIAEAGDSATVKAEMLINKTLAQSDVDQMKRLLTSPALKQYISADVWNTVQGLDPQDREEFFDRYLGEVQHNLVPLEFKMRRTPPGHWKIADVVFGDPATIRMSVSEMIANFDSLSKAMGKETVRKPRDSAYEMGESFGKIIGIAAGIVVLLFLVRRARQRN